MGNNKMSGNGSRRWFLTGGMLDSKKEKIKMLTADGKLVEVDKAILEKAIQNKKATNKEIFDWMKNPSKGNS
jgi:hypothetical protein